MVAVLVAYDSPAPDVAAPFKQILLRLVAPFVVQSIDTLADIIAIHTDPLTWAGRSFFYNEPTMIVDVSWSGKTSPKNSIGLGRVEDHHRSKHNTHLQQISHGRPPLELQISKFILLDALAPGNWLRTRMVALYKVEAEEKTYGCTVCPQAEMDQDRAVNTRCNRGLRGLGNQKNVWRAESVRYTEATKGLTTIVGKPTAVDGAVPASFFLCIMT
jgi:hypothetical protein